MKKIFFIVFLMLLGMSAQGQTKEEIKAQRKAERQERARIQDSIYKAEIAREKRLDEERRAKNGATSLLVTTVFEHQEKTILDMLVRKMIERGDVPASIDKDYYIIKSSPKMAGSATYETTYTIYLMQGKVCIRAASVGYKSFSVGAGMLRSNTDMVVPLEYGGADGSACDVAWKEMEYYLLSIPHTEIQYIKP